ncbi:glycerophosphodiester phosphodiesterase, partial [Acinetobacter baumannii]
MFRKSLINIFFLSLFSLFVFIFDSKTHTTPTTPEYQLPKIVVVGH